MTADPICPGVGPRSNHPGCWMLVGTSTVPTVVSPRVDSDTDRSMAATRSDTGTEWATTGATTTGGTGAARNGGEATGGARGWRWTWSPRGTNTAATTRSPPDTIHQGLGPRD